MRRRVLTLAILATLAAFPAAAQNCYGPLRNELNFGDLCNKPAVLSALGSNLSVGVFAGSTANGKIGGASGGYTTAAFSSGATTITIVLQTGFAPVAGQHLTLTGVTTALTVSGTPTTASGVTTVHLSGGLPSSIGLDSRVDFWTQDDLPAFQAALAAQVAAGGGSINIPSGEYYLSTYIASTQGIRWRGEGAFFAWGGGLSDNINQSMAFDPMGSLLSMTFSGSQQDQGINLNVTNNASSTPGAYQKNAYNINIWQNAVSSYTFLGDASTYVRDLVGYSVQANCPPGNLKCSVFGANTAMFLQSGSDGPSTGMEWDVNNNSGVDRAEMGSWDNVTAWTIFANGTNKVSAGTYMAGGSMQVGSIYETNIAVKSWATRTAGTRNASGIATTHTDYAYASTAGKIFGQTAQFGAGVTVGDTDPLGGVNIPYALAGELDIGDSRSAYGPLPTIKFSNPRGQGTNTPDVIITDLNQELHFVDLNGNVILDLSNYYGAQAPGFVATAGANTTPFTAGNGRAAGNLQIILGTGYDVIRELGSAQAFHIETNNGTNINMTFGTDGSVTPFQKTVATLPTCNGTAKGEIFEVTDALTPAWNATLTGSGAVTVLAMCSGTNWTAH